MQISSFDELRTLLDAEKVPYRADDKLQFVEIPTNSPPLEGSLAIVWDRQDSLVQFIHIYTFQIPEARVHAMEEAVARVNHALALPGFGIDHDKLRAYYRVVLPRSKDRGLDSTMIGPAMISLVDTTRDFLIPLQQVAIHGASPHDILERARLGRRQSSV